MQNRIKINIGVAEIVTLLRARNIIIKYLLVLHLAVYHHPEHIWKAIFLAQRIEIMYTCIIDEARVLTILTLCSRQFRYKLNL